MERYSTKEGLEKMKKELEYLEKVKRREVAERIRHAASYGDLKENASYDEAKNEQGFMEAKIRELKDIIARTQVLGKQDNLNVQMGSTVTLESEDGKEKFQIVGPEEADVLNGKISFGSSLGKALLGSKKGEAVKISTPGGERRYKIIEIK